MQLNPTSQSADAPPPHPHAPHDARVHKVELLIGNLLRVGVVASLIVVTAGTIISFVHHPQYVASPHELDRLTRPGAAFPKTIADVITGVRELRGQAIVVVGLLLLVATPVARVAISIFAFIYQRDRIFTLITAIVLALLLLSFILGQAE